LAKGFVPNDETLEGIRELLSNEQTDGKVDLLQLDRALDAAPQLGTRWQAMKDTAEQSRRRMTALGEEVAPIANEFMKTINALMVKHNITDSERKLVLGMSVEALSSTE